MRNYFYVSFMIIASVPWFFSCSQEEPEFFVSSPEVDVSFFKPSTGSNSAQSIFIENLTGDGAIGSFVSEVPATVHDFPLDPNNDQSLFFITIDGVTDTLGIQYERNIRNVNTSIAVEAARLEVFMHSYDSVKVICDSLCLSYETKINIYF